MRRSDLFSDDLNIIKNRYKYTQKMVIINLIIKLIITFLKKDFIDTGLDDKFKQLNENLKIENKKKLEKLIKDFNNIKIKAKNILVYSDHLLMKTEEDYLKNKNKNGGNEYYDKVCRGIMDSSIEQYIS